MRRATAEAEGVYLEPGTVAGACQVARYARAMRGPVTVHMAASADRVWDLVSDITRIGD
jgi:hypothetical protein